MKKEHFLTACGWNMARVEPFSADFSSRCYARLYHMDGRTAILMEADTTQNTPAFVAIDGYLRSIGLAAPIIYSAEPGCGLVLLEDFGHRPAGAALDQGLERALIDLPMVDLLVHLHHAVPDRFDYPLPHFNSMRFSDQIGLFVDHYVPYHTGKKIGDAACEEFRGIWQELLRLVDDYPQHLLLRDYMPDNVMLLPERSGVQSLGLLDFQDAGWGPVVYDLASVAEMVRRDGGWERLSALVHAYKERSGTHLSVSDIRHGCLLLWVQRHMRVMGIIASFVQKGRLDKAIFLPRVQRGLRMALQEPELSEVRHKMSTFLGRVTGGSMTV